MTVLGSGIGAKMPPVGQAAVNSLASSFTDTTRVLVIIALATAGFTFVALRNTSHSHALDEPSDPSLSLSRRPD